MINYRDYFSKGKRRRIRLYGVWANIHRRCAAINCIDYKYYGGRGITVCDEWRDFLVFRAWAIQSGYRKGLSIDRRDNDGNYEPSNCRWATAKQQVENRTYGRFINPETGIARGHAKLTWDQVAAIRADNRLHRVIADEYGVCRTSISNIKAGISWKV